MSPEEKRKKNKRESIEEILGLLPPKYDMFCSYAHSDNELKVVDRILKGIKQIYKAL